MTWVIIVGVVLVLLALGQLRVHRTEKIRLRCLEAAVPKRAVSAFETGNGIVARAAMYEEYVRKGIPEKKEEKEKKEP